MLEREGAMAALRGLLAEARQRHGDALFVVGDPGLGKTAILEHVAANSNGFTVAFGRGQAVEAALPFGIVGEAVRELGLPMEVGSSFDARATYFYAILQWLERVETPTLVVLDDLHWADPDSMALVSLLCRRIATLPIALLGSIRPWPEFAVGVARHLTQQGFAKLEVLTALTEAGALELLRPDLEGADAHRAYELCGGNPLLLKELAKIARANRGEDWLRRENVTPLEPAMLLSRFVGPGLDLRYSRAAAIFGIEFRPHLAGKVAGLSEAESDKAIEALTGAGLVSAKEVGRAHFTHPLFRQALYEDMPASVRERRHASAFAVLLAHGVEDAEIADHAVRGNLVGNQDAIAVLERAARSATAAGAFATGQQHAQAAVRLAGANAPSMLLRALADAALSAGDAKGALTIYDRILDRPGLSVDEKALILRLKARARFIGGGGEGVAAAFEEAAEAGMAVGPASAVEALLEYSSVMWITTGPERAGAIAARARQVADTVAPALKRGSDTAWAFTSFLCGDPSGFEELEAAAHSLEANPMVDLVWGWSTLGSFIEMTKFVERYAESERVYELALQTADLAANPMAIGVLTGLQADTFLRQGRLASALILSERSSGLVDLVPAVATYAWVAQADTMLAMGRIDQCEAWCDRLEGIPQSFLLRLSLLRMRGVMALRSSRAQDASDIFERLESIALAGGLGEPCVVPWARDAISAHLFCDRPVSAHRVLDWIDEAASRLPCRWPRMVGLTGRAALADRTGNGSAAEDYFLEAVELHQGFDQPLAEAQTVLELGSLLRRKGDLQRARTFLARAVEIAQGSGATWLAENATTELHAAGGRRRRNPGVKLTPQEDRIVRQVERGLSDAAIARQLSISVRTVETHLQHVFRKLNIRSRRDLILQKFSTTADDKEKGGC